MSTKDIPENHEPAPPLGLGSSEGLGPLPERAAVCTHRRYTVDVREQTGRCIDCGAEGRMRFVVGALLDRRVRPRAAFEAWISAPPYERDVERFGEGSAWPGNYRDIDVDLAWNAWLDAMTMTRERCASIAENYDLGTPEGHAIAGCIRGA